jgi:hypothetical protein
LTLQLVADSPWSGRLVFDRPRHRTNLHLPLDYPRINQFPEWYTVEAERHYRVTGHAAEPQSCAGQTLLDGLPVSLAAGHTPLSIRVSCE